MGSIRLHRLIATAVCLSLVGLSFPAWAATLDPRLQSLIGSPFPDGEIPVIVTFRGGVEPMALRDGAEKRQPRLASLLKERAGSSQKAARDFLRSRNVADIKELNIINGLAFSASVETLRELAARADVAAMSYDEVLYPPEIVPALTVGRAESNISLIKAPELWSLGYAGQGIVVATMDTGVDATHPDLASRWRGGNNSWFDPNGEHLTPIDLDGHGTSAMGVILGGDDDDSYIGVAPEARWIAVKIFNDAGAASTSAILEGFDWLLDPDYDPATDDAPHVVNNSWGFEEAPNICDESVTFLRQSVAMLKAAGIAVLFPAGNLESDSLSEEAPFYSSIAPASYPESFAVGSVGTMTSETAISNFSLRGPSACDGTIYPELVAPGFYVKTTGLTAEAPYQYVTGTSIAVPHVAGAMALLLSAFPDTRIDALESALKISATDLGPTGADNTYGYGLLNVRNAYALLNGTLLGIIDPVAPTNDSLLPFGHVAVGSSATQSLILHNDGSELLLVQSLAVDPSASPFSVVEHNCAAPVAPGGRCTVTLKFAPTVHQAFGAQLLVASNGSAGGVSSVELTGSGNTPPPAPQPLAPVDGASNVVLPVTLRWSLPADVDADTVRSEVSVSAYSDFRDSTPIAVAALEIPQGKMLLAGAGGLLVCFFLTAARRPNQLRLILGVLFASGVESSSKCTTEARG
ncbi:MAG: S8 family serine peptidase [Trichloromonas sp.]|jgi:bacillopeptidase F|nr:S8 family serine peptidase [Trichloromonas sp.]